ncbi:MAG TPA: ubiquinone/menaquinone biosynthesis methyltransferase [Anaerohalosphaeraceae bacterium]|nr:ubiquinone/menaquinone biosynthesis methyltransferase [Anaerohalosphaeraceae bacterium]
MFDFEPIAARYDLCNRLFSFGLDRRWRRTAAALLNPQPQERILDLCCGTGEMAAALAHLQPAAEIVGLDISPAMIEQAREKYAALSEQIRWHVADAVRTDLPSNSFDLITCAFGLRNIPDIPAALKEMKRLLRPGGRIGILEFSLPKNKWVRGLFWMYLRHLMPAASIPLFGRPNPLIYLAESIRTWNDELNFPDLCRQAGLTYAASRSLCLGTVTLHMLGHRL